MAIHIALVGYVSVIEAPSSQFILVIAIIRLEPVALVASWAVVKQAIVGSYHDLIVVPF